MIDALRAHVRILENLPRDRIRTHVRSERVTAQREQSRSGRPTPLTPILIERYKQLKAAGVFYRDIRGILHVGTKMMKKIQLAAQC
jgi:hypothetical protein